MEVSSKHCDDWSTTDSTLEELGWLLLAKKGEGTLLLEASTILYDAV